MALIDRGRLACIGKVTGARGLHGELNVRPLTDAPEYYERTCTAVILDAGRGLRGFAVRSLRSAGGHWVLALAGVEDRPAAEALRGAEVLLEREALKPLEAEEYFADDLIGCEVLTLEGERIGAVSGVMATGANDVLEVSAARGTVLVPLTEQVVKEVDVAARRIRIDALPGLLDAQP